MKGIPVKILRGSLIGLELGAAVGIGVFVGVAIDHKLGTSPWLSLAGLLFGLAAGIRNVIRIVKEMDDKARGEDSGDAGDEGP